MSIGRGFASTDLTFNIVVGCTECSLDFSHAVVGGRVPFGHGRSSCRFSRRNTAGVAQKFGLSSALSWRTPRSAAERPRGTTRTGDTLLPRATPRGYGVRGARPRYHPFQRHHGLVRHDGSLSRAPAPYAMIWFSPTLARGRFGRLSRHPRMHSSPLHERAPPPSPGQSERSPRRILVPVREWPGMHGSPARQGAHAEMDHGLGYRGPCQGRGRGGSINPINR